MWRQSLLITLGVILAGVLTTVGYSAAVPKQLDTVILIALNLLPIAVFLAFWPWLKRRHAEGHRLSNVTTVTIIAVSALICLGLSHFAMYMKILTSLLVAMMWFLVYRHREQGPVMCAVLLGLAAIIILS